MGLAFTLSKKAYDRVNNLWGGGSKSSAGGGSAGSSSSSPDTHSIYLPGSSGGAGGGAGASGSTTNLHDLMMNESSGYASDSRGGGGGGGWSKKHKATPNGTSGTWSIASGGAAGLLNLSDKGKGAATVRERSGTPTSAFFSSSFSVVNLSLH